MCHLAYDLSLRAGWQLTWTTAGVILISLQGVHFMKTCCMWKTKVKKMRTVRRRPTAIGWLLTTFQMYYRGWIRQEQISHTMYLWNLYNNIIQIGPYVNILFKHQRLKRDRIYFSLPFYEIKISLNILTCSKFRYFYLKKINFGKYAPMITMITTSVSGRLVGGNGNPWQTVHIKRWRQDYSDGSTDKHKC